MTGSMVLDLDPIAPTQSLFQWIAANREGVLIGAIVAVAIVGVMMIARLIGQRMVARESEAAHFGWQSVVGRVLARTGVVFMVVSAITIVTNYAEPPARAQHLISIAFTIVFAFQGAIWARELILALIARKVGDGTEESALGNATAIIRLLVSVTLFALAIVVILDNLGVNVTALVAGLGIGGIAIGLAAQGIFSDLFAALAILFDKPFKRGDTIQFDQTSGTVERIGLKTTRLRSLSGEQVVMANTKLLEREIHNFSVGRARRSSLNFGLVYRLSPDDLETVPSIAKGAVESRQQCTFVRCAILGFGASSVDFELIFDSRSTDPNKIAADRTAVALALLRAFAEHKLEFAYPTQTTLTAAPDGSLIMPYAAPPKK
ncbi:MAG: mechanosensitive ion channel domain-containing protein [Pseudomonadota bacterium]